MIPRTAGRGHSFKGAGLYYLHDKQADTKDRVAWTHTHNLPTQDAEKAMKVMAFTAMNAEYYKDRVGGSKAGRKATRGAVFTFSLAWHPEQKPDKEHMLDTTFSALKNLGLEKDHQAVIVAHNDTDHPHVHIIANTVSLADGKRAKLSYDHLSLSTWAQEYEEKHGHKIYCEQRVKNNQERKKLAQAKNKNKQQDLQQKFKDATAKDVPENKPKTGIVKYKEDKHERAALIQELYGQSDSGKAFKAALQEKGYALAKGNRRSFVVIDEQGKIYSLSRQMKGFWEKDEKGRWKSDLKEKLADLELQDAGMVSKQKAQEWEDSQHYDREQSGIDQQNRMLDAADKHGAQKANEKPKTEKTKTPTQKVTPVKEQNVEEKKTEVEPYYVRFDKIQAWEQWADGLRHTLTDRHKEQHNKKALIAEIKEKERRLETANDNLLKRLAGRKEVEKLETEISELKLNLESVDQVTAWEQEGLEKRIQEAHPFKDEHQVNKFRNTQDRQNRIEPENLNSQTKKEGTPEEKSALYDHEEHQGKIKDLEKRLSKLNTYFGRKTKKYKELQIALQNIDQRISEQPSKLEDGLKKDNLLFEKGINDPKPKDDLNSQKRRLDKANKALDKRHNKLKRDDRSKGLEL